MVILLQYLLVQVSLYKNNYSFQFSFIYFPQKPKITSNNSDEEDKKFLKQIKKSMYLIRTINNNPNELEKLCCKKFEAVVKIYHHASTITINYQPVIHCGGIKQSASAIIKCKVPSTQSIIILQIIFCAITIVNDNTEENFLRNGDQGTVVFEFIASKELLKLHSRIIFTNQGLVDGVGYITKIFYDE